MVLSRVFLFIFLSFVLLTNMIWMIVLPFNEAPDEYTHFDVAKFIAVNNRFPVFGKDENMGVSKYEIPGVVLKYNASYAAMPPLAYLWQAGIIKLFSKGDSSYLAARGANLLLALATAFCAYLLSCQLFTKFFQRVTFSLVGVLAPQVTFTFAYVNSDGLLLLFSFLLWWWIAHFLKKRKHSFKESLLFGLTLGLAAITRYNVAPLLIVALVIFVKKILEANNDKTTVPLKKIIYLAITGISSLTIAGGWYLRNIIVYQDILVTRKFWDTYYMIYGKHDFLDPLKIIFQTDWLWKNFQSLWGVFGWNNIAIPELVYRILFVLVIFGLFWLITQWKKLASNRKKIVKWSVLVIFLTLSFSLWQSSLYAFQPQGRYLFPAWPGLVYLLLLGWWKKLDFNKQMGQEKWQRIFGFLLILFVLSINIYSLLGILIPAYY